MTDSFKKHHTFVADQLEEELVDLDLAKTDFAAILEEILIISRTSLDLEQSQEQEAQKRLKEAKKKREEFEQKWREMLLEKETIEEKCEKLIGAMSEKQSRSIERAEQTRMQKKSNMSTSEAALKTDQAAYFEGVIHEQIRMENMYSGFGWHLES